MKGRERGSQSGRNDYYRDCPRARRWSGGFADRPHCWRTRMNCWYSAPSAIPADIWLWASDVENASHAKSIGWRRRRCDASRRAALPIAGGRLRWGRCAVCPTTSWYWHSNPWAAGASYWLETTGGSICSRPGLCRPPVSIVWMAPASYIERWRPWTSSGADILVEWNRNRSVK